MVAADNEIEFPVWRAGVPVTLSNVLDVIPENSWFWRVLEFSGVGTAPSGMSMVDFEKRATSGTEGYRASWRELRALANGIRDSHWLLLVAGSRDEDLDPIDSVGPGDRSEVDERRADFRKCLLVVRLVDSGSWWVAAPKATDDGRRAVEAVRKKFAINYANVSEALLVHLPELLGRYEELRKDWVDEVPGPHIVYGDVLNRHIDGLLEANDEAALRRVFAFIELIANSSDTRVRDVVGATVCWYLGGHPDKLSQVQPHMGPTTRQISNEIQDSSRRNNHPK